MARGILQVDKDLTRRSNTRGLNAHPHAPHHGAMRLSAGSVWCWSMLDIWHKLADCCPKNTQCSMDQGKPSRAVLTQLKLKKHASCNHATCNNQHVCPGCSLETRIQNSQHLSLSPNNQLQRWQRVCRGLSPAMLDVQLYRLKFPY